MTEVKRKRRIGWVIGLAGLVVLIGAWGVLAYGSPSPVALKVSRETTYFTQPVRKDGTVDYAATLNRQNSRSVTTQNNTVVPLLRALGPERALPDEPLRGKAYELLGMEPLPAEGDYFVPLEAFATATPAEIPEEARHESSFTASDYWWDQLMHTLARPWSSEQFPVIAAWLETNAKPLMRVVKASKRPHYFWPFVVPEGESLIQSPTPWLDQMFKIDRALIARAMRRVHRGQWAEAWKDVLAVHRLAQLVARGDAMVNRPVAISMRVNASVATMQLLRYGSPSADQLARMLEDLKRIDPWPELDRVVEVSTRIALLDLATDVDRRASGLEAFGAIGNLVRGSPLNLNWILRRINQFADRFERALSAETLQARVEQVEKVMNEVKQWGLEFRRKWASPWFKAKMALMSGEAGRHLRSKAAAVFISLTLPALEPLLLADAHAQTRFNLTLLAVALELYRTEHGAYPKDLEALTPEYFARLPQDPFAAAPPHYRRTEKGYLLYSIGGNFEDDDGEPGLKKGLDKGDVLIRMPRELAEEADE